MTTPPLDVFGQPVAVGDYIAAGMALHRSSVLRVGQIVAIKETNRGYNHHYGRDLFKYSISVRWTHDGNQDKSSVGYGGKTTTTIQFETGYSYAKFLKLPASYVEGFKPDIKDPRDKDN